MPISYIHTRTGIQSYAPVPISIDTTAGLGLASATIEPEGFHAWTPLEQLVQDKYGDLPWWADVDWRAVSGVARVFGVAYGASDTAEAAAEVAAEEAAKRAAEDVATEFSMDWLDAATDWLSEVGSDIAGYFDDVGGTEAVADAGMDLGSFEGLGEGLGDLGGEFSEALPESFDLGGISDTLGQLGDAFGGLGLFGDSSSTTTTPRATTTRAPGGLMTTGGGMYGDDTEGGGMVQTAGMAPMVGAGALWLGSWLARAFGRGAAGAVFTAANGVRVRLSQLWPLVRKYGWQAVAGGLGLSTAGLATLLAQAPTTGTRRRRRGISYADISRTRRTIKQLRKMSRLAGIGGGGGRSYRSYRPRRSYARYR